MSLRAWDSTERGKAVEERMFPWRRTPASCCPPSAGVKRPDESGKWQGGQAKEAFGALFCLLRVRGREGRLRKLFGQLSASCLLLPSPPARLAPAAGCGSQLSFQTCFLLACCGGTAPPKTSVCVWFVNKTSLPQAARGVLGVGSCLWSLPTPFCDSMWLTTAVVVSRSTAFMSSHTNPSRARRQKITIQRGERAPKMGWGEGGGAAAPFLLAELASAAACPRAAAVEGGWEPGVRGLFGRHEPVGGQVPARQPGPPGLPPAAGRAAPLPGEGAPGAGGGARTLRRGFETRPARSHGQRLSS